ncbi:hypothetical protein Tco_0231579 [Tanacetum coccineum]
MILKNVNNNVGELVGGIVNNTLRPAIPSDCDTGSSSSFVSIPVDCTLCLKFSECEILEAISFVLAAALTPDARLSAPDVSVLKLLENMKLKVTEEYKDFSDVASGLRFFVERLTAKRENFDEYV